MKSTTKVMELKSLRKGTLNFNNTDWNSFWELFFRPANQKPDNYCELLVIKKKTGI